MRTRFPLRSTSVMESLLDSDMLAVMVLIVREWKILRWKMLEGDWVILRGNCVGRGENRYMQCCLSLGTLRVINEGFVWWGRLFFPGWRGNNIRAGAQWKRLGVFRLPIVICF